MRLLTAVTAAILFLVACGSEQLEVGATAEPEAENSALAMAEETPASTILVEAQTSSTVGADEPTVSHSIESSSTNTSSSTTTSTVQVVKTTEQPKPSSEPADLTLVSETDALPQSCLSKGSVGLVINEPKHVVAYLNGQVWMEADVLSYSIGALETLTGADVDGDGEADFVQNYVFESDDLPGGSVQAIRVCGTETMVEDFIQLGANKPTSVYFYVPGQSADILLSMTSTGAGIVLIPLQVLNGSLQLTDDVYPGQPDA